MLLALHSLGKNTDMSTVLMFHDAIFSLNKTLNPLQAACW